MPKKFLVYAFELAVVVALLYVGLQLFDRAKKTADVATQEQEETGRAVEEHAIMRYDGLEISGATAISYIKTVIQKYELSVEITTSSSTFTCADSSVFAGFRDITSSYYINPMAKYLVAVERNDNDVISGVKLTYAP